MRHGKSAANEESLIDSSTDSGIAGNHLTEEGKTQVESSIEKAKGDYSLDTSTIIVSSDFARTKDTAEIVQKVLGASEIELSEKLRERSFGAFDGTTISNYEKVWEADQENSSLIQECEVENVEDVQKRVLDCVQELERRYSGKNIFLISHGDTLQILQVSMQGISPSQHRSVPPMQNAEIRKLNATI